jgi:flagellar motor switch protein FliM
VKPEGSFVAQGLAAQHCPELLHRARPAADPLQELGPFGERLSELLERELPALFAGNKPTVVAREPSRHQPGSQSEKSSGPLVCTQMAVGPRDLAMAAWLSRSAVAGIVDLVFGGDGDSDDPGGKLPRSAMLTYQRFERILARSLANALHLDGGDAVKLRDTAIVAEGNAPFAGCNRAVLPFRIAFGEQQGWELHLAIPPATLNALFAGAPAARSPGAEPRAADPLGGNKGDIPLNLTALLVEMEVPVGLLSRLAPGMILPVSVARNVPLYAGETMLGHGSIGTVDDRAALKLTRISPEKEN